MPHVELDADDEKSREGNGVVIRVDLAADLKAWLADKLAALQLVARSHGDSIPVGLPADALIFDVPAGLLRIFDRDLTAAGIAKRDDRGRTLDLHALRTTFGTLLSNGGVPLRTAQAAMRHSDPSLTANVYTGPVCSTCLGLSTHCRPFRSKVGRPKIGRRQKRPLLTTAAPLHCLLL